MKTLVLIIVIITTIMVSSFGWTQDETTINNFFQFVELLAFRDSISQPLKDITQVRISATLDDPHEATLFTAQELKNQLLVGLRSKIPQLVIGSMYAGNGQGVKEYIEAENDTRYSINLNIIVIPLKNAYLNGYTTYITLHVDRYSIIPGPTSQSAPIKGFYVIWTKGVLLTGSDKSRFKENIDDMITEFAAEYYKQNSAPKNIARKLSLSLLFDQIQQALGVKNFNKQR